MLVRSAVAVLVGLALSLPAVADESGSFVVRLGQDTTGVERYTRTDKRLEIEQVGRSPRVLQRRYVFKYGAGGAMTSASATVTVPGTTTAMQQIDVILNADSLRYTSRRDTVVQTVRLAAPAGTVVYSTASPWALYEGQTMKLAGTRGADSLRATTYPFGSSGLSAVTVRRLGADSMVIQTASDRYHARVDAAGRIQAIVPIVGTQKYSVDRVAALDVPAVAASFAAREKQGGAMGALSVRDTVNATAGGATVWLDYSRPSKRGRVVFGGVVPWDQLWRTGANMATQFRTDKALAMGGVTVPAGFYTLWTIPSPRGWKLIINSETGITGTDHKAEKDLYTIPMTVSSLTESAERFTISIVPGDKGGVLHLDWDTTRASVPFTVAP